MKITLKLFVCGFICVCVVFSMTGCPNPVHTKWRPDNQPNTIWSSDDGMISFQVYEDYTVVYDVTQAPELTDDAQNSIPKTISSNVFGTLEHNEKKYDIFTDFSVDYCITLYLTSVSEIQDEGKCFFTELPEEYILLRGGVDYKSNRKFVVTVYDSQFYEEGAEIVFRRVDD